LKMDNNEFDKTYLDWTLEESVRKVRMFKDLVLPEIRGTLSRGYGHSPEEDFHATVGFLERKIKAGYKTFRELRDDEQYGYMSIRAFMHQLHERWRFPL